ncbi:MAG: hypothetical protein WBC44_22945 [Planctomycetaceae bacterium]
MRFVPPNTAARATLVATLAVCTVTLYGCKSSPFQANPFKSDAFAHRTEKRVVNEFADALAEADSQALAKLTSSDFQTTALADERSIAEVKRIWPVKGKLEVVAVKDVPADELHDAGVAEKLVTVKDERDWKTDQRLVRNPETEQWLLDEILITKSQRGITATKTVSEQIVFINVIRDFAFAWRGDDREKRLAGVTAECRAELEPLPEDVLNHLARRMFPPGVEDGVPEATMDDDIAIVRLERPTSEVHLQLKRIDGRWLVDDAALGGKEEHSIPSLRKTAVAYAAAVKFLAAYNSSDRETLKTVATETFFDATLKSADLSSIPLPPAAAAESGELKIVETQGELVIDEGDRTIQLALVRTDDAEDVNAVTEFRVEDVTLYENGGAVKKRLASALVAVPMAHLYADALVSRDVAHLRVMATRDFIDRVWEHVDSPAVAASLPLSEIQAGERKVLSVVHNGASTEVTMMQANRAMTYVLRDEGGEVKIDDVLLAVADRPPSLKTTLMHVLPIARLQTALAAGDVEAVRKDCSSDFNRLIWSQVRRVPPTATAAARFLDTPLTALKVGETEATARFGSEEFGGVVTLLENRGQWKIHDMTIVAGSGAGNQASLKPLLRDALANGTLFADAGPSGTPPVTADAAATIQQASYEVPATSSHADNVLPASVDVLESDAIDDPREPRPLDLGASADLQETPELAPEAQENLAKPVTDKSALPFTEPLW